MMLIAVFCPCCRLLSLQTNEEHAAGFWMIRTGMRHCVKVLVNAVSGFFSTAAGLILYLDRINQAALFINSTQAILIQFYLMQKTGSIPVLLYCRYSFLGAVCLAQCEFPHITNKFTAAAGPLVLFSASPYNCHA